MKYWKSDVSEITNNNSDFYENKINYSESSDKQRTSKTNMTFRDVQQKLRITSDVVIYLVEQMWDNK